MYLNIRRINYSYIQEYLSNADDVRKSVEEAQDLTKRLKRETCSEDSESRSEKVNEKVMYISVASIATRLKKSCVLLKFL